MVVVVVSYVQGGSIEGFVECASILYTRNISLGTTCARDQLNVYKVRCGYLTPFHFLFLCYSSEASF